MAVSRNIPIPPSRSLVLDILHYDRQVPSCAHDRIFDVSKLAEVRRDIPVRISWPAIFLKAYALTAGHFPRLRQTWMKWPWPHLYEHDRHVATLVMHRHFENDDWLFWGRLVGLSKKPLAEIQQEIEAYQSAPVEEVFSRQLWLARRSVFVRRLFWALTFHVSGKKKCKRLGTFFLSTISGRGAEIQQPPSMLTSGFTFGPINEHGRTRVTITYDHRLLDGHHVADILERFEETLNTLVVAELHQLRDRSHAA